MICRVSGGRALSLSCRATGSDADEDMSAVVAVVSVLGLVTAGAVAVRDVVSVRFSTDVLTTGT
jgi:hypothetical protein